MFAYYLLCVCVGGWRGHLVSCCITVFLIALRQCLSLNVELGCQPASPRALTFPLASPPAQQTLHGFHWATLIDNLGQIP